VFAQKCEVESVTCTAEELKFESEIYINKVEDPSAAVTGISFFLFFTRRVQTQKMRFAVFGAEEMGIISAEMHFPSRPRTMIFVVSRKK
jgi:hypothetical protein